MGTETELEQIRAERDLLRSLLDLGGTQDLQPFLKRSLELVAKAVGAQQGFIEVAADCGPIDVRFGLQPDEINQVRAQLSSGIVLQALRTGRTVSTASAVDDPSFSKFASVQANRILAVLCAPIELGDVRLGVLYLTGRSVPGPFSEAERTLVERVASAIAPTLDRVLDNVDRTRELDYTKELRTRLSVDGIIGTSDRLATAFRQLLVAAPVDIPVLFLGDSGTGKSAFARALHDSSSRKRGPFVEINAGALPEQLVESELFGAEKGAHSTASHRITGKIDAAQGGSLFLDEIAEMPLSSQAKLLTFLQSKKYYRLGGSEANTSDVRIIAATNQDLQSRIRAKTFREDLYYRLSVLEVRLPSLDERRSDIRTIAEHLLAQICQGKSDMCFGFGVLSYLQDADWPGNVRQLENAITRGFATALSEGLTCIELRHLTQEYGSKGGGSPSLPDAGGLSFRDATLRFQAGLIERALEASEWNVSDAARRLDMARSHLNALIKSLGLKRVRPQTNS